VNLIWIEPTERSRKKHLLFDNKAKCLKIDNFLYSEQFFENNGLILVMVRK